MILVTGGAYNGKTEFGFFITLTNEEIKPIVVIEKPKPMT